MCSGEPFGVYEYGTLESIEAVTPARLGEQHLRLLGTAPVDVFAVGDLDPPTTARLIHEMLPLPRASLRVPPEVEALPARNPARRLAEFLPWDAGPQGELVIGYRTRIRMRDPLSPALIVLDDLMGGGPSSRLFRILREEQQLMYSISSFLVKSKGLWMVVASVEPHAREVVERTVQEELDRIAGGEIDETELDAARRQVLSQVRTINDAPGRKISFLLGRLINQRVATPDEVEAEFRDVTRAEVVAAAGALRLDTSYFLASAPPDGAGEEA
jgi:predicted Zn-dependent peptidase